MIKANWMVHDEECEKISNPNEQGCGCLVRFKVVSVIKTLESENAKLLALLAKERDEFGKKETELNHSLAKCRAGLEKIASEPLPKKDSCRFQKMAREALEASK